MQSSPYNFYLGMHINTLTFTSTITQITECKKTNARMNLETNRSPQADRPQDHRAIQKQA